MLPELQQPNIVGNFLSSYGTAQAQQQAQQDREFNKQRVMRQDDMAEQQFGMQKQAQQFKLAEEVVNMLGSVQDGDEMGFERAKQRWAQMGLPPEAVAGYTVADLPMLRVKAGTQLRELQVKAQEANIRQSNAAAAASYAQTNALKNRPPAGVDPTTGVPKPPPGVEGRDYSELSKFSTEADAAAKIASTLQSVMPAIKKGWSGPDFGTRRTVAGALWALPGPGPGKEIIDTYDQIDQAAKISGIEALKGIGGSDTERELLTAIQTGVNPELTQKENERRARGQIAAADILSKKAQLASEWVNRFGSLKYAAPDGTTWQKFWPQTQREAWAEHRKREAEIAAAEKAARGKPPGEWKIEVE